MWTILSSTWNKDHSGKTGNTGNTGKTENTGTVEFLFGTTTLVQETYFYNR
jgi:hypothetical protein